MINGHSHLWSFTKNTPEIIHVFVFRRFTIQGNDDTTALLPMRNPDHPTA